MVSLAVLLTVHNRKDCTEKALCHLYKSCLPDDVSMDVYLTDDGCTDGTQDMIRLKYPSVVIIKGDGNLFWNRGMHLAWEKAASVKDYDYYLWLNDDTYIYDNAIKIILANSHDKQDEAIIVGATMSKKSGECTYGLHDEITGKLLIPNGTLQQGTNMNGNFVLIPKYVYSILGNLDSYYHHGLGDTDYGLRAIENHIEVLLSKKFVGYCERHSIQSVWCNPDYPVVQRWKALNKPTGMPLRILYYHERNHYGFFTASFHFFTTVLHCIFPSCWNYCRKLYSKSEN
jgi:GT2 family glycosyltransferase